MRREISFSHENCAIDQLPPTQNALLQHTLHAVYQAGTGATSLQTQPKLPPSDFAWERPWVTIPEVSKV